jgi:hypothetical protein
MHVTVNLQDIQSRAYKFERDGDDLKISSEDSQVISKLLDSNDFMNLLVKLFKKDGSKLLTDNNAKKLVGEDWTLFFQAPSKSASKYKVDDNTDKRFKLEITHIVPFDEAIEQFKAEHGKLPDGVQKATPAKPSVKITRRKK